MEFHKYNQLRNKINRKDFEGNFKILDLWLYIFSFIGNIGSVLFSYFLVYPSLFKALSINMANDGSGVQFLSLSLTLLILVIFEIIKRYVVSSFSFTFISNKKRIKASSLSWLVVSISILALSFYLSIIGSKNFASTGEIKNEVNKANVSLVIDSLNVKYENSKLLYIKDNEELRAINNDLRKKLGDTPMGYVSVRNQYQLNIDKNVEMIEKNDAQIQKIDERLKEKISDLNAELDESKLMNYDDDFKNITLFIIIAIFCELIIFAGIYFREYFQYNSYLINRVKYEKIYTRKERYRALLGFIYNGGTLNIGNQVIGIQKVKDLVADKSTIQNSDALVEEFFLDMDRLKVFVLNGTRRKILISYDEALEIVESFDDTLKYIENMK